MVLFLSLSQDRTFLLKIDSVLSDENHSSNVTNPFFVLVSFFIYFQNQKGNVYIYIRQVSCCEEGFLIQSQRCSSQEGSL